MDNLAPTATQRPFDDVGRSPDETFRARKKPVKKALPSPGNNQDAEPEIPTESEPVPATDHQLDLLA